MSNTVHSSIIGKGIPRVDAYDKVTGSTMYTDDLCDQRAYIARLLTSTIAHGKVLSIDTSKALAIPGVVKVVTCFDVPKNYFPTAGHPWSTDPSHQDICDRLLLSETVRFYGDPIAAVIAENEVQASQALALLSVTYDEYPFVLDAQEAMKEGAPQIFSDYPNNVLKHTSSSKGNFKEAIKDEELIKIEGWYETPGVQHCHIENCICYAESVEGRMVITSSTQIPHIVRRVVGQALQISFGKIRVVKPYVGGGFGNKQDVLFEPLCAFLSTLVHGKLVKLETTREETFVSTRIRHGIRTHLISYVKSDGTCVARKVELFSNQGGYASHGHSIVAKAMGAIPQLYPCEHMESDSYTVFTNRPVAGAMRGYGIPQAMFALESHVDDIAKRLHLSPLSLRQQTLMPVGYKDNFSKNVNYFDSFNQCLDKGMEAIDYHRKYEAYQNQTGTIRKGVGLAVFWYNTAVWPISLESCSSRMVLNQDGSVQVQLAETEIGQGADTAFGQMTADALGVPYDRVHVVSVQDTDLTPFGTGAYASRQTYVAGFSIVETAKLLKGKLLSYASKLWGIPEEVLDLKDGLIINTETNTSVHTLEELAMTALYSLEDSKHFTAEKTTQIKSNAYSFGCSLAEVEVDINACKIKLVNIVNVHDCGRLINPVLAEAQVHGGMSMGIGFGLSEKMMFDPKTGRMLNDNLLDYKLSTTMDHPDLQALFVENPEPTNPFGTKALGEPPVCSVAPAIRNALLQATGVPVFETPMSPHVVYEAFKEHHLLEASREGESKCMI